MPLLPTLEPRLIDIGPTPYVPFDSPTPAERTPATFFKSGQRIDSTGRPPSLKRSRPEALSPLERQAVALLHPPDQACNVGAPQVGKETSKTLRHESLQFPSDSEDEPTSGPSTPHRAPSRLIVRLKRTPNVSLSTSRATSPSSRLARPQLGDFSSASSTLLTNGVVHWHDSAENDVKSECSVATRHHG